MGGRRAKYPVGTKLKGRVTNITDYGAFVELEPGVEGLVHVSEMSWTKKNVHPGKIVSTSQEVEVVVLEVDPIKRRISLGLKQTTDNPWESFSKKYPPGTVIEGEIRNITEFGLFVGLDGDVDGMVHLSDLSWEKAGEDAIKDYQKGQVVKAKVLDVDTEKERISLGIKELTADPMESRRRHRRARQRRDRDRHRHPGRRYRSHGGRRPQGVHPPQRSLPRPLRAAPGTFHRRSEGRCPRHPVRQGRTQDRTLDQGAGNRRRA